MIQVSRLLIKQFRAVLRHTVLTNNRNSFPVAVLFEASPIGCTLRSHFDGIAVSNGPADHRASEFLALPADALANFEGRGQSVVTLEAVGADQILARWEDGNVPREQRYTCPKQSNCPAFPRQPDRFTENDAGLLKALHEGMQTAAPAHARFAIQNIQLRGRSGEIVASDCRQLLLQSGFQFPWTDDVLVPRVRVFGHDLGQHASVGIARIDDHVCVRVGEWIIWLPIDKEGRFPKHENVMPALPATKTHLRFSVEDAAFLVRTLPSLPGDKEETPMATLDISGQVVVRARGAAQDRSTEVVLTGSSATGKGLRCAVNRAHFARALELSFTEMHFVDPNTPALCIGERGKYVFTCMPKEAIVASSTNDIRLSSKSDQSTNQPIPRREPPVRQPQPNRLPAPAANGPYPANGNGPFADGQHPSNGNGQPVNANGNGQAETKGKGFNALLEEAQALHDILRDALNRSNQLIGGLKNYRRHAKNMQSTLATLRQLQTVEA